MRFFVSLRMTQHHVPPLRKADLRTDGVKRVRIANRLSVLLRSNLHETLRAWSKYKTGQGEGLKNTRKAAFTLAEVLITLGIIGVVAAITMPILVFNIRVAKLQSQFKKNYTDLNNAAKMFEADKGITFNEYQASLLEKYPNKQSTEALKEFLSYYKSSESFTISSWKYRQTGFNSIGMGSGACDKSGYMRDMNGRIYEMDDLSTMNYGPKICVDINGLEKPNIYGVDIFIFIFKEDGTVVPNASKGDGFYNVGLQVKDEEELANYCKPETKMTHVNCGYFALINKNPQGDGDYWHDFLKDKY